MTVRHRFPSAFLVNVMPVSPLPTVRPLSSSSATSPAVPVRLEEDELPEELRLRRAAGVRLPPVVGPATEAPADGTPGPDAAAGPPEGEGVCDAAAVCGAGVALFDGWPVDDWVTEVEAGVDVGVVVLFVSVLTAPVEPVETGTVVVVAWPDWAACNAAIDGFEPPVPLGATVVLGADCAAVLVAGAAVVGGVAGATVVTGALLAPVP